MTKPTSTISLVSGGTTVTLNAPASGYHYENASAQSLLRTAAGDVRVYDKNVTIRTLTLPLVITASQKSDLESFFNTTVDGMTTTFTFTDHYGTAHASARFADPTLTFQKTPGGRYAVVLTLLIEEAAK